VTSLKVTAKQKGNKSVSTTWKLRDHFQENSKLMLRDSEVTWEDWESWRCG
jgi:hypothetical protein